MRRRCSGRSSARSGAFERRTASEVRRAGPGGAQRSWCRCASGGTSTLTSVSRARDRTHWRETGARPRERRRRRGHGLGPGDLVLYTCALSGHRRQWSHKGAVERRGGLLACRQCRANHATSDQERSCGLSSLHGSTETLAHCATPCMHPTMLMRDPHVKDGLVERAGKISVDWALRAKPCDA